MHTIENEHFVTCFDSYFLPQGLALFDSLQKNCPGSILWIICLDQKARNTLEKIAHPGMRILYVGDLENERLLSVKPSRTKAEYIWTLSPFFPGWVFENDPGIKRVTFLDADMFFFNDPAPIFREFEESGKDVLITEHAFDKEYEQSVLLGRFCVQLIIYNRMGSERVREWWKDRCIEWCFARWEDGKFGDQKYLDEWPKLFPENVHILKRLDLILAPWNASRYPSSSLILWHFHGLRLLSNWKILLNAKYKISKLIFNNIYLPYVDTVASHMNEDTYSPEKSMKYSKWKQGILFSLVSVYKVVVRQKWHPLNPRIKVIALKK